MRMATRARLLTDTFGFTYADLFGEGFGKLFPKYRRRFYLE